MSFTLSSDPNFHYEIIRSLGLSRYFGGDINEQLSAAAKIVPGDIESWYREWAALAERVLSTIDESKLDSYSPVTLKDVYFRASHYYFVADFFLHGNQCDPRPAENYRLWRSYFDKANAQLPIPGQHVLLPTEHGFEIPLIIYRAAEASPTNPRPTLIVGGGFDSNYEECLHWFGFPALERGYNVIIYEGPGQPTLLQKQRVGFIYDWEKAVSPIVDHLIQNSSSTLSFVDTSKIGLVGMSLGGYLAARAAAFEPRLAAVFMIDGVWDYSACVEAIFPGTKAAYEAGDVEGFDKLFDMEEQKIISTGKRWCRDHTKYSFQSKTGYEAYKTIEKMKLDEIADKIKMPAFVGEATDDLFFGNQPAQVVKGIGKNAFLAKFGEDQAAQEHSQAAASVYLAQTMYEWFAGVIGERQK